MLRILNIGAEATLLFTLTVPGCHRVFPYEAKQIDAAADLRLQDDRVDALVDLAGDTEDAQPDSRSEPRPPPKVIWQADHEEGDISDWGPGSWSGFGGRWEISPVAHSGCCSAALTIGPGTEPWREARLRRMSDLPPEAYYSAWVYLPSTLEPKGWYNFFLWQMFDGAQYLPMYALGIEVPGTQERPLELWYKPDHDGQYDRHVQGEPVPVPRDEWFHVEMYYKQDPGAGGRITVWQDGQQIFDVSGKATILAGQTSIWSVGYYTEDLPLDPPEATMYVDDAAISVDARLGPR